MRFVILFANAFKRLKVMAGKISYLQKYFSLLKVEKLLL